MPAVTAAQQKRASRLSATLTWAYLAHVSLHVIVPPLLFLVPELLPEHLIESGLHRPLIAAMLCASTIILTMGWCRHRDLAVLLLGCIGGLALIGATWVIGVIMHSHHAGILVGTLGSLLLAAAHWRNHRLWRTPAVRDDVQSAS